MTKYELQYYPDDKDVHVFTRNQPEGIGFFRWDDDESTLELCHYPKKTPYKAEMFATCSTWQDAVFLLQEKYRAEYMQ